MANITDLIPYENTVELDIPRKLKWSNEAIFHAITYYKNNFGRSLTFEELTEGLKKTTVAVIVSLMFGALKAAWPRLDENRFAQICKFDDQGKRVQSYSLAVMDGMSQYLPDNTDIDIGDDLDEDWPDTQAELRAKGIKQKEDWGYWAWFCNSNLGGFLNQTLRSMGILHDSWLRENGIEMVGDDDGEI